jgi:hypothetical protein
MKNKISKNPFKPIINVFARFNLVIFITVIVGGLIASILTLNNILRLPYDPGSFTTQNSTITFDETTIVRVNALKTSSDNLVDQPVPSGRINLFSE